MSSELIRRELPPTDAIGTSAPSTRSPLARFALVCLLISWVPFAVLGFSDADVNRGVAAIVFALAASGPSLSAFVMWRINRRDRIRSRASASAVWPIAAVALGAAPSVLTALASHAADPTSISAHAASVVAGVGGPLGAAAYTLISGPLSEEFGWRGYLQPRLRLRLGHMATVLIIGAGWGLWHLPLFFLNGTGQQTMGLVSVQGLLFFVSLFPLSYTFLFVSESLRGGVWAAILLHASWNLADALMPPSGNLGALLQTTLMFVAAAGVAWRWRQQSTSPTRGGKMPTADSSVPLKAQRYRLVAIATKHHWRGFGYQWMVLLLAPFGFVYAVVSFAIGSALALVGGGLFVLATTVPAARAWGAVHRSLQRLMLIESIPAPPPRKPRRVHRGYLRRGLGDAPGWRVYGYLVVSFFLSVVGGAISIALFVVGLGLFTHWYWSRFLPAQQAHDGSWHVGVQYAPGRFIDTPPLQLAAAAAGLLVLVVIWPAIVHATCRMHASLGRTCLGPSGSEQRVLAVEASRWATVENSDRRLRRLERDLHDGPQAQLVTVALKLGDAVDRLERGDDPATVAGLLKSTRTVAQDTLVGVRGLARGIHPPALDFGLDAAVCSLAAGLQLHSEVRIDLPDRPGPAIESIAYYSIAELAANAVKHAKATRLSIVVGQDTDGLSIRVEDDGRGGAAFDDSTSTGSGGLRGLAGRLAGVDGTISVMSPAGGPTRVQIYIPNGGRA